MKNIDTDDLVANANDLQNALEGVAGFAIERVSSETKVDDINILMGFIKATLALAEKNVSDLQEY